MMGFLARYPCIQAAVCRNSPFAVRVHLALGASPDATLEDAMGALTAASCSSDAKVMGLLLAAGADPACLWGAHRTHGDPGASLLEDAISLGYTEQVRALLDNGIEVSPADLRLANLVDAPPELVELLRSHCPDAGNTEAYPPWFPEDLRLRRVVPGDADGL